MFFKKKTIAGMAKSGDLKKLESTLTDQNINERDEKGFAPLYYAVKNEQSSAAKLLLEKGASQVVSDDESFSLMDMVARLANENMWKVFLDAGCHLPETMDGEPTLHWLVTYKYYAKCLLDLLLATGVDINTLNAHGQTALAYMLGHDTFSTKALSHLLEAGIDVNYASEPDNTPLLVALGNRELPCSSRLMSFSFKHVLSQLVEHGLDLGTRKRTLTGNSMSPALMAMQSKKPERFLALFEAEIVLTEEDIAQLKGYITTHYFNKKERKLLVMANEQRGSLLPVPMDFYDKATLAKMVENMPEGTDVTIEMVKQIAMNGEYSTKEKIALLGPMLRHGVDLNEPIQYAMTDMTLLCAITGWSDMIKEPEELIQWLLERGATIEANGFSAWLYAIWVNNRELATMLAGRGADLDFVDRNGMSFESMIITPSPRGDLYATDNDVFEMFTHISDLYKQAGQPFPVDRRILSGRSMQELTFNRHFLCAICIYSGTHQRRFLKLYVDNGWDLNQKFELAYTSGVMRNLTFFDHVQCGDNTSEPDSIFYLETYPQIQCGTSDDSEHDTLYMAIKNHDSPEVIEMIIARTVNIHRVITREFSGDVYKAHAGNYLTHAIAHGINRSEPEKAENTNRIMKALIQAGCKVDFVTKTRLAQKYQGGGLYRDEESLLETVLASWAGEKGALAMIETLLDNNAPVHTKLGYFEEGFSHFLCGRIVQKHYEFILDVLEMLHQRGLLDLEETSNNGATPLLHAAGKANVPLVKWLIERGANVMAIGGFDQSTAINRAISNFPDLNKEDRLETVKCLLDAGADINYIDNDGFSPLMIAVYFGCYDIAKELIARGADLTPVQPNSQQTLMHMAITTEYAYDLSEDDATYTAAESKELRKSIITLLVESGVDIDAGQEGWTTPLCQTIIHGDIDMFKILTKCGADSNRTDLYGRTAAMITCMRGGLGFVNTILGRRKTLKVIKDVDNNGQNVLHYAAQRGVDENDDANAMDFIKKFMQFAEVPLVADSEGTTPLHYASNGGKSKTVALLLEKGCDINQANSFGNTPLHHAADITYDTDLSERREFIQMLLENGADTSIMNGNEQTAADLARMCLDEVDDVDGLNAVIGLLEGNETTLHFD